MKRFIAFSLFSSLFLTACGTSLDVADPAVFDEYPELEPVAEAWQDLVNAAEKQNCEALDELMRKELFFDLEECEAVYAWFEENPNLEVDWERSEWNGTGLKVELHQVNEGDFASLLFDSSTDLWQVGDRFWE